MRWSNTVGLLMAGCMAWTYPSMARADLVAVHVSGTVESEMFGLSLSAEPFLFEPPFDAIPDGAPFQICIVYDTDAPLTTSDSGTRTWNNAIVSVTGSINGVAFGEFVPNPAEDNNIRVWTDPADLVDFSWDTTIETRELGVFVRLVDSSGTLFPGSDVSSIPTDLPAFAASSFTGASMSLSYWSETDLFPASYFGGLAATGTVATGPLVDCNANLLSDECELAIGSSADCNNNGIPDECDIESGDSYDCNCNGVPDECDLQNPLMDMNNDGYIDSCTACAGDTNCDGVVNGLDAMNVFYNLGSPGPLGDVNDDGHVTFLDYYIVIWNYGSVCP